MSAAAFRPLKPIWRELLTELDSPETLSLFQSWQENPGTIFRPLAGLDGGEGTADPWQEVLLRDFLANPKQKWLLCCSRQIGKSAVASALALMTALREPESTTLVISASQRQSAEVMRKVRILYWGHRGEKLHERNRRRRWEPLTLRKAHELRDWEDGEDKATRDGALTMEFGNGSRVISLPTKSATTVGFTVSLLILDEAARIPDETYFSLSATRATTSGAIVALSTPLGKRGWFYELWKSCLNASSLGKVEPWRRVHITVDACPRIDPEWLRQERQDIGERWWAQEYRCEFVDTIGAVFAGEDIEAATKGTNYDLLFS